MSGDEDTSGGTGVNEMVGTSQAGTRGGRFGDRYGGRGGRGRQLCISGCGGEEGRGMLGGNRDGNWDIEVK